MRSLIFLIINIIFALPHAITSYFIDTGMMKGTSQTENAYMSAVLIVWLVYSYIFTYIKEFIRFLFNRKGNISELFNKIMNWVYCIASVGFLFLINRSRELGVIGDSVCVIVIIFDLILVNIKSNKINENGFFDDLLNQEKGTYDKALLKKEHKKQRKSAIFGAIFGVLSVIVLLISRYGVYEFISKKTGDNEIGIFGAIVSIIVFTIVYGKIFNKISISRFFKNVEKTVKKYWIIVDVSANAFKIFTLLSYSITLLLVFRFNPILSLFVILGVKWINYFIICGGFDPDYKPTSFSYSSDSIGNWRTNNSTNDKKDWGFSTVTRFDEKGNYAGSATTYNIGGMQFTDVKNKDGKIEGSATSFEVGGVQHTIYKDR